MNFEKVFDDVQAILETSASANGSEQTTVNVVLLYKQDNVRSKKDFVSWMNKQKQVDIFTDANVSFLVAGVIKK